MNKNDMLEILDNIIWEKHFSVWSRGFRGGQVKGTLGLLCARFSNNTREKLAFLAEPSALCELKKDTTNYIEHLIGAFDEDDTESLEAVDSITMDILDEVIVYVKKGF